MKRIACASALIFVIASAVSAREPWESAVLGDRMTGLYADGFLSVMLEEGSPGLMLSASTPEGFAAPGVPELDAFCRAHGVRRVRPYYEGNYPAGPCADILKRWYLFEMDQGQDVPAAAASLGALGIVQYSELYPVREKVQIADIPNDPMFTNQWALPKIEAPYAWHYAPTAAGVQIGIIDSGVDWDHTDLYQIMGVNAVEDINGSGLFEDWSSGSGGDEDGVDNDGNGYIDDVVGWSFTQGTNDVSEAEPMHGTHVAGCATAVTDNGIGIAGTGWDAHIIATMHSYAGSPYIWGGFNGVVYCNGQGVPIANTSWGGYNYSGSEQSFINAMTMLLVGAAGNDNSTTPHYPSSYTNVIGVGATESSDLKADFSNYGSTIDVMSPGVGIASTWQPNAYEYLSGTSMASPIVAGVCALVKATNPGFTRAQITQRIRDTADDIYPLNPGYPYPMLGEGRVNAYAAVASASHPRMSVAGVATTETAGDGDGIFDPGETANLVLTLSVLWQNANNITMDITSLDAGLTVTDGTASFGTINAGATGDNSSNPFVIVASPTAPPRDALVEIHAIANGGVDHYIDTISVTVSMLLTGFPVGITAGSECQPTCVDLDNDGTDEIVIGAGANVRVYNHDGSAFAGWPQAANGTIAYGGAAVGDIDNDNALEIVVATRATAGSVYAYEANGALMPGFPVATTGFIYGAPALADLDGNGDLEIIFGGFDKKLHALDHNGAEHPGFPYTLPGGTSFILGGVAIGNVDADANLEIALGSQDGGVYVVNHNGTLATGWPHATGGAVTGTPAMANLDGDSQDEIVVGSRSDSVFAFNGDGSVLSGWPVALSGDVQSAISIGDLTTASGLEILVGNDQGDLYVFNQSGAIQPGWPKDLTGQFRYSGAIIDIDGDGVMDVAAASVFTQFHAYSRTGAVKSRFPITLPANVGGGPTAADINANGTLELVLTTVHSTMSLLVYDMGYQYVYADDAEWIMYAHDPRHTSNYNTVIVSAPGETAAVPTVFALHAAYPNPFNPATTFVFDLPSASHVRLELYNVLGQRVATLVDERMGAGRHEVRWDASAMASGVYFVRIVTDQDSAVRKVVLLK